MRFYSQSSILLAVALISSVLLSSNHVTFARPQSGNDASGVSGAASGPGSGGASATSTNSSSSGGSGDKMAASASLSTSQGSLSASLATGSSSGSSSSGSSGSSTSGPAASSSSGGSSGGSSAQAPASASVSSGSTTPKPEGLLGKMKDMFKEGKEMVKNSVENLTGIGGGGQDDKKDKPLSDNNQSWSSTPKPEGLIDKVSDLARKGKEAFENKKEQIKESFETRKEQIKESFESKKEAIKDVFESKKEDMRDGMRNGDNRNGDSRNGDNRNGENRNGDNRNGENRNGDNRNGDSRKDDGKLPGESRKDSYDRRDSNDKKEERQNKEGDSREGVIDKVTHYVAKGTEAVRDSVHRFEDKAHDVEERVQKVFEENITKPMQSTSGSGTQTRQGEMTSQAAENSKLRGSDREKHLIDVKKKQESEMSRPSNLKEVVRDAKSRGVIPQNEDRSVLRGNHDDEKSMTVEVFDKAHEISKIPVETVLKPLDKMLGYEKDPLLRMYDNSHELLRKPLGLVAKPVESMLTGAFKTTDETKKDNEKLLSTTSEQERKDVKAKEERAKKEDRSIVGDIADKTLDLATKPFEIVLKPFDHFMGFDKDGKKNPLLKTLDSLYSYSKRPVDAVAKPFESILRKMADGEQMYQVSIRYSDSADPKLVTRLADGALNIADRVITRPLEVVMKPLNHALGFDEPGKKNPIVEAAHSLKNSTKMGVELFTKPIDRIIKEIADIGEPKNDADWDSEYERQKEEASRLVHVYDKLHDAAQFPFEIVLRPVNRVLGINKDGKKDPILRAWDIIHQVMRTPIQVISKPVEDALLGSKPRKYKSKAEAHSSSSDSGSSASASASSERSGSSRSSLSGSMQLGPLKTKATISTGNGDRERESGSKSSGEIKKNFFTENIKKVEKLATKPLDVITSPIRRLILGEDNEKVGSDTEKNNREVQARSRASAGNNKASRGKGEKQPDKIITTIERMNNVILKPFEVMTQPISDILSPHEKRSSESKSKKSS